MSDEEVEQILDASPLDLRARGGLDLCRLQRLHVAGEIGSNKNSKLTRLRPTQISLSQAMLV